MRYLLIAWLSTLTFILSATTLEQTKPTKEQMNMIHNALSSFLGKIEFFDCQLLNGGLSNNEQYVCTINNAKYMVRILKKSKAQRESEIATHIAAMNLKIAPALYYYSSNDEMSVMIMDFINDHTLWIPISNNKEILDQIADKLRIIAQFSPDILTDKTPVDLFQKINHSWNTLKILNLKNLEPMLNKALEIIKECNQELTNNNYPPTFSHGDLHPRNIFFTNQNLIFIDWEMACMHHNWYDIVCCSIFLCLNKQDDNYLLTKYLQRIPSKKDIQRFRALKLMVRVDDVLSVLAFIQNIPDSISIESIKDFIYYDTIFAQNSLQSSDEFLYAYAISELKEFFTEYNML